VQALAAEGIGIKAIVRRTGCSRQVVRRIVRGERDDVFRIRQSSLERWLPRLDAEWTAGCAARRRALATPARRRLPGQPAGGDGMGDAAAAGRDRPRRPPPEMPLRPRHRANDDPAPGLCCAKAG
jgi:hypothetical protein